MAPFGDGGGEEDDGGGDARRGWDPLRSGSAPPTMEGSAAAAAVAAEGMLRDGGGPAVGSYFSGVDGLGARLDEVSRRRGAVAQVKGVLGLELIEDSALSMFKEHIGNSASLFVGQQGLLFNGMTELEERQFGPSRVHSDCPVANYSAFDVASLWSDTETDKAKFCKHVQNRFLPNTEMMNAYGTRDLTAPYFSESDLSDALSGLRLSNSTAMNERNHEEELLDEMLKRRRDFSTKLCDDNRSHLDGNFFCSPRSERLDAHSPSVYGDGILRRQASAFEGPNVSSLSHHYTKDVDHLSFAEQLAIMESANLHRDTNLSRNATMSNMINPMRDRYNITDFDLVRNRKAYLENVLAHQYLQDEILLPGLPYKYRRMYHEEPHFPYSRMQRSGSHFHPNLGNIQSNGDRQSRHFPFSRKATSRNMGSQVYHDNSLLKYQDPLGIADRNGVDSLELVDVVGHVKEVRQYGSIWKSVYPTKTGECIS
ncbi:hypothetical protein PR202_ga30368 [Eleusine coracana subsp. coracana]|uniref:Uncharacterized protein n=1 Tax=Eleusine coracana subsp. coracana TaxID=191504 RepID=A0AAV5DPI3_ELECO|nr:hypothetical protein PR202_ga30368 [Eleusine coracana subsp. coracana]